MDNLFVQIVLMMAFCFAIGFAVAAVIKLVAYTADSLNYYHSRSQELKRLKKIRKYAHLHTMHLTYMARSMRAYTPPETDTQQAAEAATKNDDDYFPRASIGLSEFSLMDYYYPDERIDILENIEKKK
jgi:hypothetical protein